MVVYLAGGLTCWRYRRWLGWSKLQVRTYINISVVKHSLYTDLQLASLLYSPSYIDQVCQTPHAYHIYTVKLRIPLLKQRY